MSIHKQILIHGLLDIIVPVGISLSYIDRAKHAGDEVKMIELPNVEHFEIVNPQSAAWPTIADEIVNLDTDPAFKRSKVHFIITKFLWITESNATEVNSSSNVGLLSDVYTDNKVISGNVFMS